MTPERFAAVRALFDECVEQSPLQREAFLAARCAGDAELVTAVRRLLDLDASQPSQDPPDISMPLRAALSHQAMHAPERIGRFRVLRLIGRGGMGAVYEAEQDNPRRTVAMKVIRPDFASSGAIRRFENEAQILGRLQHPGIAHIYEAGVADLGLGPQPYFAMELIVGETLLAHADAAQLDARQRLELFARVCEAVDYAHRAGVIHRDLKPGNILVDPTGQPKILDFGVARITDEADASRSVMTLTGQIIGTLSYMSPEQVAGDGASVDRRSDVYSLGVILFELLTGRLPHDLRNRSIPEAARAIREDEPSRLSSVDSALRGDLDIIVAKSLEKERDRRYQSAADLLADIRRFLRDEPIVARPATTLYQIRKFARRHRGLVFGVGLAIVILIAGIIATSTFAVRESRGRRQAQISESQAKWEAYRSCIGAAESALQVHDVARATQALARAQPELRGWEWRYYHARLDQSERVIDLGTRDGWGAAFVDGGSTIAALPPAEPTLTRRWNSMTGAVLPDGTQFEALSLYLRAPVHAETWTRTVKPGQPLIVPQSDGTLRTISRGEIGLADDAALESVTLSTAGHLLAFGIRPSNLAGEILLVDQSTHPATMRSIATSFSATVLVFSPDEMRLLSADERSDALIWDTQTGSKLATLTGHRDRVIAARFTPDSRQVTTASWDSTLRLWKTDSGESLAVAAGHTDHVQAVAVSSDGRCVASGGADGTVRLWSLPRLDPISVRHGHTGPVRAIEFAPDGRRAISTGEDGTARIWDTAAVKEPSVLRGHNSYVYPVAFRPDGKVLASGGWDGSIRLWDVGTRDQVGELPGADGHIYQLVWSPDGELIVSTDDSRVMRVWDIGTRKCTGVYRGISNFTTAPAIINDGPWIALPCVAGGATTLWNSETGETRPADTDALRRARGPEFSPIAAWMRCSTPASSALESLHGAASIPLPDMAWGGCVISFSTDGRQAAYARSDHSIVLIDLATGGQFGLLRGHTREIFAVAFSPDGRRIASAGRDEAIRLWDVDRREEVAALRGHTAYVWSLAWSPDGQLLASGSGDQTVRIWDTRENEASGRTSLD